MRKSKITTFLLVSVEGTLAMRSTSICMTIIPLVDIRTASTNLYYSYAPDWEHLPAHHWQASSGKAPGVGSG